MNQWKPEGGNTDEVFIFIFQVIEFSPAAITGFIAMVGILSIVAQVRSSSQSRTVC